MLELYTRTFRLPCLKPHDWIEVSSVFAYMVFSLRTKYGKLMNNVNVGDSR